ISELQLQDLLRNLRYQLHNDYYNIAQFLNSRNLVTAQLARLTNLQTAMEAQLKAGNISQKDYLRVQALVIGLQQDLAQADRSLVLAEEDLKMLLMLGGNTFVKPNITESNTAMALPTNVDTLIQTARQNNAFYLLQQAQHLYSLQNITYQKALAVPDVTLGPEFDKNSNYTPNYVGFAIGLPLPFWNRNQGNIKAAEFTASQQRTQVTAAALQLQSNVSAAYQRLLLIYNVNNNTQKEFYNNYKNLFNNVVQSYQQRQISLLEFLDFADSYQQSLSRFLEQQNNLQLAKEELNYQVGTIVIK
ncbi:MAG: TolC family protein, partial [Bacteroidota bacterium]|nr:TolC family protein [Bacteroidota bacterium]